MTWYEKENDSNTAEHQKEYAKLRIELNSLSTEVTTEFLTYEPGEESKIISVDVRDQ